VKNQSILIVEDQSIFGLDLKLNLNTAGYNNVATCFSGKKALEHIEQKLPDVALVDIKLSDGVSGLEVASRLLNSGVPVIFISAFSDPDNLKKAKNLNPFRIIQKPIDAKNIVNVIEDALRVKQ
jgi:1,2-diacylglycerol 3-beta-glucosyltransferase